MRLALATLALTLVLATEAPAAPQSLTRVREFDSFALAGDAALLTPTS